MSRIARAMQVGRVAGESLVVVAALALWLALWKPCVEAEENP